MRNWDHFSAKGRALFCFILDGRYCGIRNIGSANDPVPSHGQNRFANYPQRHVACKKVMNEEAGPSY
jgi:hypothetical protein